MLLNLHKKSWMEGLTLQDYSEHCKLNETIVKEMLELAKNYNKVCIFNINTLFFKLPEKQILFNSKGWNGLKAATVFCFASLFLILVIKVKC